MEFGLSVREDKRKGPRIEIDCPRCGALPVKADTEEYEGELRLLFFIPILKNVATYVTCTGCRAKMLSEVALDDLPGRTPVELRDLLIPLASTRAIVLVGLAIFTVWIPAIGVVAALIAVAATFSAPGWPRVFAWLCLLGSGAVTVLLAFALCV